MFNKLWEIIFNYFKQKPYWRKVQLFFILISFYLISVILAYQFVEWQYQVSLSLSFFVRSYIFKQITIIFIGICLSFILFKLQGKIWKREKRNKFTQLIYDSFPIIIKRIAVIGLVIAIILPFLIYFSPHRVSHIRIKFLNHPDFDKYAFVYLIYELNKIQRNWYFEVDFEVFDETILTSKEREKSAGQDKWLSYAKILAKDQAFIGITTEELGEDFFWKNQDEVSVISTYRWQDYSPPSIYEYLCYSIIVQSILIHLDAHCSGLPKHAFKRSYVAHGDLFQFSPRRSAIKAEILAAHLSPNGELLLLNCFGIEYMTICSKILTLEWIHSKRITENLERSFDVNF